MSDNPFSASHVETASQRRGPAGLGWLTQCLPAVFVAAFAIGLWHAVAVGFELPSALLPRPSAVVDAAWKNRWTLATAFFSTGLAATAGLISAITLGCLISVVFSQSRRVRMAFFPYVIFLQTVPIVAIAPLLIIWSGYQFRTVAIVTVIVCLFPIVNSVTAGLTAIDKQWSDLFTLYGASRAKRLARLQMPAAVPFLILGAKTSGGLAVIGAIVAEFFVGSGTEYDGLGTLMMHWQGFMKTDALVAAVFASTLLGLLLFGATELVSATLLRRWTRL